MTIDTIISRLKERYPPGKFGSRDPFHVLIATVLSQRTRDEVTDRASERLFAKYTTCIELARADTGDIEELIRDVGFYRTKGLRSKFLFLFLTEMPIFTRIIIINLAL